MYSILMGDAELFYPGDAINTIMAGKLNLALNDSGSLDITIPPINPYYNSIKQRATELTVKQDDTIIFNGEVREIESDFYKNKSVYAVGEMAFLNDSIQPLARYEMKSKIQMFNILLTEHNNQVEARKRFEVGFVSSSDATIPINEWITEWEGTLDYIRENLCNNNDCLRVRRENGKRYLDIVPIGSYGKRSEQYIEFGENLLDYQDKSNSSQLYTAVIPLGAEIEGQEVGDRSVRLTIESVNSKKNYLYSQTAVNNYGWIKKVVEFSDITDPNELKKAGQEWLTANQYEKNSYTIKAVDMSIIDTSLDKYSIGDYIRCLSDPHGMDVWLPVRKREINLLNIEQNTITLGAETSKSFTKNTIETVNYLEKKMPEKNAIIQAALRNASQMINANGTNGNVAIMQDSNGKPYEILIMDASTIEQSTRAWRWNLSGFGHGTKEEGAKGFNWNANVAITMNGDIIANSLNAFKGQIAGFKVTENGLVHYNGTYNDIELLSTGKLILRSASNNSITLDKNGLVHYNGTYNDIELLSTGKLITRRNNNDIVTLDYQGLIRNFEDNNGTWIKHYFGFGSMKDDKDIYVAAGQRGDVILKGLQYGFDEYAKIEPSKNYDDEYRKIDFSALANQYNWGTWEFNQ